MNVCITIRYYLRIIFTVSQYTFSALNEAILHCTLISNVPLTLNIDYTHNLVNFFLFKIKKGSSIKNSFKGRVYESVDDRNLSSVIFNKSKESKNHEPKGYRSPREAVHSFFFVQVNWSNRAWDLNSLHRVLQSNTTNQ